MTLKISIELNGLAFHRAKPFSFVSMSGALVLRRKVPHAKARRTREITGRLQSVFASSRLRVSPYLGQRDKLHRSGKEKPLNC
jgi:hypothetical protein